MGKQSKISDAAWAQTEGGLAVVKVARQMDDFERKWMAIIPGEKHMEFSKQLYDLVQAARIAGQKE